MTDSAGTPRGMSLLEAAEVLRLPEEGIAALVGAGYLRPAASGPDGPRFALGDLKAFLARNADDGSGIVWDVDGDAVDPLALLNALDGHAGGPLRLAILRGGSPRDVVVAWS